MLMSICVHHFSSQHIPMLFGDAALENEQVIIVLHVDGSLSLPTCTPKTAALADFDHSNNNVSLIANCKGYLASIHAIVALVLHQACRQLSTPNRYIKCDYFQSSCG